MVLECYQKMYAILCFAASEAIDVLQEGKDNSLAARILQNALWEAEELYISERNDGEA